MKYTISLMLLLISIGISQEVKEAKIDSVAIQAELAILFNQINEADRQLKQWQINRDQYAYAWNVLAKMLVPKVEPVVEENKE